MKKYTAVIILIVGLGLVLFTPDYDKLTGSTYFEACSENDLFGGCINGMRQVATDSLETNYLYLGLFIFGIILVFSALVYLSMLLFKKMSGKSS